VFDVGANQGQFASMVREEIKFRGPIISFEPIPSMAANLRRQAQNDPHWFIEEVALDHEAGKRTFNIMAAHQLSSLLDPSEDETQYFSDLNRVEQRIEVETSTLDAMVQRYRSRLGFKRPFLKMDTQGNDLAVATGGEASLSTFVGLQTEVEFKTIYKDAANFFETVTYYEERGFELSNLLPNNEGWFPHLFEMDLVMFNKTSEPTVARAVNT
jgi:FkbM family methyltransferase